MIRPVQALIRSRFRKNLIIRSAVVEGGKLRWKRREAETVSCWQLSRRFQTLVTAGYYTIEQRSEKYRIIFLNTNLWLNTADNRMLPRTGSTTIDNTQDPFGQWKWFESTLDKARRKKETVSTILYGIL